MPFSVTRREEYILPFDSQIGEEVPTTTDSRFRGLKYAGVMTALVTPFDANGSLHTRSVMSDLICGQEAAGVDSLLVLGGTGEYTALSVEERTQVLSMAVECSGSRLPVVAGVLCPGLDEACDMCHRAQQCGADGAMVVTPYYASPSQIGLLDYYKRLVDKVGDFDVLVYNIPSKTSVNILPSTVAQLAHEIPSVVGIKECATSFSQILDLINVAGNDCVVLSGDEGLAIPSLAAGADGVVMATANLVPSLWVRLYRAAVSGAVGEAFKVFAAYRELIELIFSEGHPGPLKWILAEAGIPCGQARSPLMLPSEKLQAELRAAMETLDIGGTGDGLLCPG